MSTQAVPTTWAGTPVREEEEPETPFELEALPHLGRALLRRALTAAPSAGRES